MKLIGSRLEKEIEEGLRKGRRWVFGSNIYEVIRSKYGEIHSAYVLQWTPDQAHDLYCILLNGSLVACLEVPRFENLSDVSIDLEEISLQDWRESSRKRDWLKLEIALKLAQEDKQLSTRR
jgi:hypothetical protein